MRRRLGALVIGLIALPSCAARVGASSPTAEAPRPSSISAPAPKPSPGEATPPPSSDSRDRGAPATAQDSPRTAGEPLSEPSLPKGVVPGELDVIAVPDGRHRLRVIHARASSRLALIYLHGMCGNIRAPEQWAAVVSAHATLIALEGELYCGRPGRFKWSRDIAALDRRVDEALNLVRERRGGLLDLGPVAVMGYSQGATRAAMLAAHAPDKYPWVLVAGIPSTPRVDRVGRASAIAVLGGEHEPTKHMKTGVDLLEQAGRNVRYFHLPGAEHGQYGPEGPRVLGEAFDFVLGGAAQSQPRSSDSSGH